MFLKFILYSLHVGQSLRGETGQGRLDPPYLTDIGQLNSPTINDIDRSMLRTVLRARRRF